MTLYSKIQKDLENDPQLRERRFSRHYLAKNALFDTSLYVKWQDGQQLTLDDLIAFYTRYDSYRHEWGKVLLENPHLRGADYSDGKILSEQVQLSQGYEPQPFKRQMKLL